ncbi:hypothetical protein [Nonomuraea jabiensis]|uniref:Cyclophilin-like domain-containing protein n=1 Tax=Nonomuraea jabiensis TaxID=882448 RepID=A0A7W9GGG6_9ACTN|nr:hypothetical protein [Nonomuraea jabiensis]MBB5783354.1 hypothetical protein [Nonomuraea jabiensis]
MALPRDREDRRAGPDGARVSRRRGGGRLRWTRPFALPERLITENSPGSATRAGALIHYAPRGNIGFIYRADGKHDDNVITHGAVESGMGRLELLERNPVYVELLNP